MKREYRIKRSRSGMAMLVVLFMVMAIAVISVGFMTRSDTALACGRNFCVRNEADYAAWGGLEVAWAVVQDPNTLDTLMEESGGSLTGQQLDGDSDIYYDLTIGDPDADIYSVTCTGYKRLDGQDRARSTLYGELYFDTDSGAAYYVSVRRRE